MSIQSRHYVDDNLTWKDSDGKEYEVEFPQEIEILGKTFTLEDVSEGSVHPEKGQFYNAEYC